MLSKQAAARASYPYSAPWDSIERPDWTTTRATQLDWSSERIFLATAVLGALFIRLIVVAFVFRSVSAPTFDHNEFGWEMGWTARSIALGHGFSSPFLPITGPTALVPPLYPYLLAGIFKLFGIYSTASAVVVLTLNSLFSALTCIPVYFSLRNAANTRAARLAAIGWAIYPFAIYFSAGRVWDYALTGLLFASCFWAIQSLHLRTAWAWVGFGLLAGVAVLSNPSVLSLLPFLLLFAILKASRLGKRWLPKALLAVLACTAISAPWAIRNHRVLHTGLALRDGFWLEFYAGNNGDGSDSNAIWAHPASNDAEMQRYRTSGELTYMAQKRTLALDFVQHHPGFFVRVSTRRMIRFWTGYWSFSRAYLAREPLDVPNFFFCSTLTLLLLLGLFRWWQQDRAATLPYLLAIIVFPLPYYLTHSSMDYRQPIEPLILSLVIVGIFGLQDQPATTLVPTHSLLLADELQGENEPAVAVA